MKHPRPNMILYSYAKKQNKKFYNTDGTNSYLVQDGSYDQANMSEAQLEQSENSSTHFTER